MSDPHKGYSDLMEDMKDFSSSAEADFLEGVTRASGITEEVPMAQSVGLRVKAIREMKGLSYSDLAQRTGFSETLVQEIESGEALPPLGDLVKLARALDMKMGYLLVQGEAKPYAVVRKQDRKAISRYGSQKTVRYGYAYESLAPEKRDRNMEPFIVALEPRTEEEAPSTHDGEEFIYVLEGMIEVQIGEKRERLEPEDSIYYDSTQPHLVRCAGDRPARILAVLYTQGKK
ncbi:MAG: helix-turn-helix transcriptional regulator [Deltaproteobacteria bacterium]|nr:helix-turn-helix transcriptional regulator [Deltaproteobacteria bacterium]